MSSAARSYYQPAGIDVYWEVWDDGAHWVHRVSLGFPQMGIKSYLPTLKTLWIIDQGICDFPKERMRKPTAKRKSARASSRISPLAPRKGSWLLVGWAPVYKDLETGCESLWPRLFTGPNTADTGCGVTSADRKDRPDSEKETLRPLSFRCAHDDVTECQRSYAALQQLPSLIASSMANTPFSPPQDDLCPVHDLPSELLSYIFELHAWPELGRRDGDRLTYEELAESCEGDDERMTPSQGVPDTLAQPIRLRGLLPPKLTVSHVCKYWRDTALANPSLWTRIVARRDDVASPPFTPVFLQTYLQRSGALSLDIDFQWQTWDDESPEDYQTDISPFLALLYALLPCVPRWRTFNLDAPSWLMDQALYILSDTSLPAAQLESLQLQQRPTNGAITADVTPRPFGVTLFGGAAPRLHHLLLVDMSAGWLAGHQSIRTLDLEFNEECQLSGLAWGLLLRALRALPCLETLKLTPHAPGYVWTWAPTEVLEMPYLTKLVLRAHACSWTDNLLTRLAAPNLISLEFDFPYPNQFFVSLLCRMVVWVSSLGGGRRDLLAGLKEFVLTALDCESPCTALLYRQLIALETLELGPSALVEGSGYMEYLSPSYANRLYLPTLKTLRIRAFDVPRDRIRKLAAERRNVGVPLRVLILAPE
ncbi:hypothetical protein BV22DRAFT_1048799 [Leucogyrophana mollusca]|uniref:Uncharacterized protein n=1 Tax=Leucogyrophana mollusca TaxID=85980 RepID=A0ACB8BA38_9AGAM|nr:hypothetical protein BV22DRAFT_1048799 [Leucogyrophana mollusca]